MIENIVMLKGNVKYPITLDPGVWIFDDRKLDMKTYFQSTPTEENQLEKYTKEISSHWDREITEGAVIPPTTQTEKRFQKEKLLTGTFGIRLKHFIQNAIPGDNACHLKVITVDQELKFDLMTAMEFILVFSQEGKPLRENGPIHIYFGNGSNQNDPIIRVREFIIE